MEQNRQLGAELQVEEEEKKMKQKLASKRLQYRTKIIQSIRKGELGSLHEY